MSHEPGSVLRNPAIAAQVTTLNGMRKERLVKVAGSPAVEPAADAPAAADREAVDAAYQRGYEQGWKEGQRRGAEAVLSAELEQARQEGMKQGHEAGARRAQEQGQAALGQTISAFERIMAAIPQQLQARLSGLEDDMVALGFEALVRVLGDAAVSPDGVRAQLRQALLEFGPRQLVEVRVHPDDLRLLAADPLVAAWLRQREGGDTARLSADPSVKAGGVVLRSPAGSLDARLETKLANLQQALLATRAQREFDRAALPKAQAADALAREGDTA
jgi:flagellar assembly protein FliH